jgi:hypothetical protein
MMKDRLRGIPALLAFVSILLGACTIPVIHRRGADIYFQDPDAGALVPVAPLAVSAWATLPRGEVTYLAFYANARFIGESSSLTGDDYGYYTGNILWTPPAAGEYFLQVQANRGAGSAYSDAIRICVIDFEIPLPSSDWVRPPAAYDGPCPIPDRNEFAAPGPIALDTRATPDRLLYRPPTFMADGSWTTECLSPEASIAFEATLDDPPQDVAFVVIYYSYVGGPAGLHPGGSDRFVLPLMPTRSSGASTRIYTGATHDLEAGLEAYFGGGSGELSWTARAIGRDGSILIEDGPHTIPLDVDPLCSPAPLSAPFAPPTVTATPASARDCPAGTFFAEVTHRCIAIQLLPTKTEKSCKLSSVACAPKKFDPAACTCY